MLLTRFVVADLDATTFAWLKNVNVIVWVNAHLAEAGTSVPDFMLTRTTYPLAALVRDMSVIKSSGK